MKKCLLFLVVIVVLMPVLLSAATVAERHGPGSDALWFPLVIGSIFSAIGGAIKSVAGAVGGVVKSAASVIPGVGPVVAGGLSVLSSLFKKQPTTVTTSSPSGTTTLAYNQPASTATASPGTGIGGFFSQKILGLPMWVVALGTVGVAFYFLKRKGR